ncbi:SpoIIE family protein phosphatase [Egicoccus sp. AB-alg2]|uniref:SpoIIE family protein phosphatase n=1 Tax=Egicoccus sp. AB-alg2 TaxID=3242693 RepID=UPI00359EB167
MIAQAITDRYGTLRWANPALAARLGRHPRWLVGKPLAVHVAVPDRPAFRRALSEAFHAHTSCEVVLRDTNQWSHPAQLLLTRLGDDDEPLVHVAARFHDEAATFPLLPAVVELREHRERLRELHAQHHPPHDHVPGLAVDVADAPLQDGPGGDRYDVQPLDDGSVHVAVIDATGHGAPAAQAAAELLYTLRLLALDGCPLPSLPPRADERLRQQGGAVTGTAALVRVDAERRKAELVLAGHPSAFHGPLAGPLLPVGTAGPPLGFGLTAETGVTPLPMSGHRLLLVTDGVLATPGAVLDTEELIRRLADVPAAADLATAALRLVPDGERADDALALCLRYLEDPAATRSPAAGLELTLARQASEVGRARHVVRDWLRALHVADDRAGDVLLVVSELATNAVEHGGETIWLTLRRLGRDVVVEVRDDGPGIQPPDAHVPPVGSEATRGRGLHVVQQLADPFVVASGATGTAVRAVLSAVLPSD